MWLYLSALLLSRYALVYIGFLTPASGFGIDETFPELAHTSLFVHFPASQPQLLVIHMLVLAYVLSLQTPFHFLLCMYSHSFYAHTDQITRRNTHT